MKNEKGKKEWASLKVDNARIFGGSYLADIQVEWDDGSKTAIAGVMVSADKEGSGPRLVPLKFEFEEELIQKGIDQNTLLSLWGLTVWKCAEHWFEKFEAPVAQNVREAVSSTGNSARTCGL